MAKDQSYSGTNQSFSLTIWTVLISGVLLRVLLALSRTDLVWPDEHFMSIEPASKIVFDRAYLAWEWTQGYRAWTLPLLYTPLLLICKLFGISGGLVPIYLSRFFTAALSGWSLFQFDRLLRLYRFEDWGRLVTLASFSLATPMVLWGVTSLSDHWVMILWISVLPYCIQISRVGREQDWFKMGVLAGLPIIVKPQACIFTFAFLIGFILKKINFRKIRFYSVGVFADLFLIGVIDKVTYGTFFSSLIQHWVRGQEVSKFYGVSMWYDYFPKLWKDQGGLFFILIGLILFLSYDEWKEKIQSLNLKTEIFWTAFFPALAYFVSHLFVGHKETRFMLPILPFLYLMAGQALMLMPQRQWVKKWINQVSRINFLAPAMIVLLSAISFSRSISAGVYLANVNTALLEAEVYHLQSQSSSGKTCLLLIDHHWSWTRGKLILGDQVDFLEKKISEITPEVVRSCRYAILRLSNLPEFERRAGAPFWRTVKQTANGFNLLEKQ